MTNSAMIHNLQHIGPNHRPAQPTPAQRPSSTKVMGDQSQIQKGYGESMPGQEQTGQPMREKYLLSSLPEVNIYE